MRGRTFGGDVLVTTQLRDQRLFSVPTRRVRECVLWYPGTQRHLSLSVGDTVHSFCTRARARTVAESRLAVVWCWMTQVVARLVVAIGAYAEAPTDQLPELRLLLSVQLTRLEQPFGVAHHLPTL